MSGSLAKVDKENEVSYVTDVNLKIVYIPVYSMYVCIFVLCTVM